MNKATHVLGLQLKFLITIRHQWQHKEKIIYSYLVGCCSISDLFGKGEQILGEAEHNIGSPLPNKSDIGKAPDQTTVLLFPPRILVYVSFHNYEKYTLLHNKLLI